MQNICFLELKIGFRLEKIQDFPRMERTTKDKNIVMQGKIDLIRKQFGQRGERRSGAIRQAGWLCFFVRAVKGLRLALWAVRPPEQKRAGAKKILLRRTALPRGAVPIRTGCGIPAGSIRFVSGMSLRRRCSCGSQPAVPRPARSCRFVSAAILRY